MRFLVDMNLSPAIADGLRSLRFDAVHVRDVGLGRASDEEIFRFAATERRIIVTADLDFADIVAASRTAIVSVILLRLRSAMPDQFIQSTTVTFSGSWAAWADGGDTGMIVAGVPSFSASWKSGEPPGSNPVIWNRSKT